jgi:hypothetical protein
MGSGLIFQREVVRYLNSLGAVHGRVSGKCTFQTLPHGTAGALTKQPLLL